MTRYILNAFSLGMLPAVACNLAVRPLTREEARELADGAESAVGHESTAAIFGAELDRHVICARSTVALQRGDVAVVGQYVGPRLPEGATQLPEGARIEWRRVEWS